MDSSNRLSGLGNFMINDCSDLAIAARDNRFISAAFVYRSISLISRCPVIDMNSSAVQPDSARRRQAAFRRP